MDSGHGILHGCSWEMGYGICAAVGYCDLDLMTWNLEFYWKNCYYDQKKPDVVCREVPVQVLVWRSAAFFDQDGPSCTCLSAEP